MRAAIWGVGALGGVGGGIGDLASALEQGESPVGAVRINTVDESFEAPALLADTRPLGDRVDRRFLRRTEHFTRMSLLSCLLAAEDGRNHGAPEARRRGIILGTGYGSTCNAFDFKGLAADSDIRKFSPISFSNSVHNAAIAHIATILKEHGPGLAVNHFDMSVPLALMTACQWLDAGRVDAVLAGGADEYSRIMACHRRRRLPDGTPTGADPIVVGEGCVFFLLTRPTDRTPPYGYIESATTGVMGRMDDPAVDPDGVYFIGADGFNPDADRHARRIGETAASAVYTPLYGQLPAGTAFDVAIAALSMKTGVLRPSVRGISAPGEIRTARPLGDRRIHCVKPGAVGEWGCVSITPARPILFSARSCFWRR